MVVSPDAAVVSSEATFVKPEVDMSAEAEVVSLLAWCLKPDVVGMSAEVVVFFASKCPNSCQCQCQLEFKNLQKSLTFDAANKITKVLIISKFKSTLKSFCALTSSIIYTIALAC